MSTYRPGNHHGVTIICEGDGPHDEDGRRHGDALVAVVTNGDTALAEKICKTLNLYGIPGPDTPTPPAPQPRAEAHDPQPGDWVSIRAKVVGKNRPESVTVELWSHNTQYECEVRVDHCEPAPKVLDAEPRPGSVAIVDGIAYQRAADWWLQAGVLQGSSWVELNARGDVVIVHEG